MMIRRDLEAAAVRHGLLDAQRARAILGGVSIEAPDIRRAAAARGFATADPRLHRLWRYAGNALLVARDLGWATDDELRDLFAPGVIDGLPPPRRVS